MKDISGTLSLNTIKENYFGRKFTTGTMFTTGKSDEFIQFFDKTNGTLFEVRVSIPNNQGLIPHIYLIPEDMFDMRQKDFLISIMKFKKNMLSYDLIDDKHPGISGYKNENFEEPSQEQMEQFNNYELRYLNGKLTWLMNKVKYFSKTASHYLESYSKLNNTNESPIFNLVASLEIDQDYIEIDTENITSHFSFDQIKCWNLFVDNFRHIELADNDTGKIIESNTTRAELCSDYLKEGKFDGVRKFGQEDKTLWQDSFSGKILRDDYWLIRGSNQT